MIVDIGDVPVQLEAPDERRSDVLVRHLGGGSPHPGPALAVVRYEAEGPGAPDRPADHTIEDVKLWHDGTALTVLHTTGVSAVVGRDEAWVGGPAEDVAGPFHRLLLVIVTQLLAHHERYVLHAAAVDAAGVVALALGDTGRGKSTVALAGLEAGWPVLGDDMVVVRSGSDGPEVAGLARPGAMPADVASDFGGALLPGDPRGRRELPASAFTPGWFPIGVVLRTDHARTARGEVRELDSRLALYAAMSGFAGAATPAFMRRFFPVAAAISRRPTFDLLLGADPRVRLADTARLLAAAGASA